MISPFKIPGVIVHLNTVTNEMAEYVELLRKGMRGKGISPKDAPLVEMRLEELENRLRMLGGNEDDPVPFTSGKIPYGVSG